MELTIALVQMRIAHMDPLKNLKRMEDFVARAKEQGADLVVFPEDAVCGPLEGQTAFVQYAPEYLARMQALAVKHAVDLVPGSWTVAYEGLLYNQAHYIDATGALLGTYQKVNLWETERIHVTPGVAASVFPTRFGMVGLIICWDISFPAMFTVMKAQGVELVISPTYWSFPPHATRSGALLSDEVLLIDALCTTRAFENNILFAYCNAAGQLVDKGITTVLSGRSQLTHPVDKVLCQAPGNEEEMLVAHVQLVRPVPAV